MSTTMTTLFTCEVIRIMPFGLLVKLEDGRKAIIRERELAWTAEERRNWQQTYRPGVKVQAVMLGERNGESLELSVRLAQDDPWLTVGDWLSPGQLVEGIVTAVQPYGVFVELRPGVAGLLHQSNLPTWCKRPIEDVFWIGDAVKAVVQHVDIGQRRIALTMRDIRAVRWSDDDALLNDRMRDELRSGIPVTSKRGVRLPLQLAGLPRPCVVLIVDNDDKHRECWVRWLRSAGQHADGAASAEEALARLASGAAFDLVIMDVHLPGISGLEALARMLDVAPQMHGVLTSGDWGCLTGKANPALEQLLARGVKILPKPFEAEDLLDVLLASQTSELTRPAAAHEWQAPAAAYAEPQRLLAQAVLRAQRLTRASLAVLFKLDREARKVEIELPRDDERLAIQAAANLIHSPVRDVAEDREFCVIENVEAAVARVRYLLPLLHFQACLGVPVPVDATTRYALFFFYDRPTVFDEARREQARAGALAVGAALDRREMVARIVTLQRDMLLGQLNRGLVHEMNNRIPAAKEALKSLERQLGEVERALAIAPASAQDSLRCAQGMLAHALESVASLSRMNELFRRFATQSSVHAVRVEHEAQEAVQMLRDEADRAGVDVQVEMPERMVIARANPVHLQHVLLNVMLNAVQQIALLRSRKEHREGHVGRVRVRIEERQRRAGPVVIVSVEDDGPGIHLRDRQRIFDLGFTTRSDGGSGLGLYVARHLMEAMHGRIYVAESAMLWGTRIVVELPGGV